MIGKVVKMKLEKINNEEKLREIWHCPRNSDLAFTNLDDVFKHTEKCLVCGIIALIAIQRLRMT